MWEFANEAFVRGQRHVLKNIKRRRAPSSQGSGSPETFGLDEVGQLQAMDLRLCGTEKKQQKMMSFLAKAMQNPEDLTGNCPTFVVISADDGDEGGWLWRECWRRWVSTVMLKG